MKKLTKKEFEKLCAKNSGMTLKQLYHAGFRATKCACDYEKCLGWVLVTADSRDHE